MATPAPTPRPAPSNGKAITPIAKTSRLGSIKRGQLRSSLRYLFYGPEGVGKSSLVANVPGVLFFDIEGGADNIDVARYQFRDEDNGHVPRTYEEVLAGIDDLIANPGHGHLALAMDTADALEALLHRFVCVAHDKADIEAFGFGKGYRAALDEWRRLLARLDALRATGVAVFFTGHSFVKTFKNPEGEDYDRYQLHIHDLAAGQIKEWCDVVGFVRFDGGAAKLKGDSAQTKRARGWATGRRVVHLAREAAWDAKCRLSLPVEIELDVANPWQPFALAASGARNADTRTLTEIVIAELDRIGAEEFTTAAGRPTSRRAVLDMVATSDPSTIARIVAGLQATASTVNPSQES